MNYATNNHRSWTPCGLIVILCACIGCNVMDVHSKSKISRRQAESDPKSALKIRRNTPASIRDEPEIELVAATDDNRDDLPPKPIEVPLGGTDDIIRLKVADAIETALGQNLHLRVIANIAEEGSKQTEIERALFDPSINANLQYMQGLQQVASALQAVQGGQTQYGTTSVGPTPGFPNLVTVEQRFSTGTVARIGVGSNYTLTSPIGQYLIYNPAYQSAASVVIEQALFRGASRQANLAGIHLAQTSQKQSAAEFQVEINQTLCDLQKAYWAAWLAESHLRTSKEFVEQAEATYHLERQRFEIGEGGIVQSAQAKENLQSLKAELAQAQQRSRAGRNHLLSTMGASLADRRPVELIDEPLADHLIPDLEKGLATAVQMRPEVQVRQLQVAQAQLELERRRNAELPDVRAYAGYSITGLNDSLGGSIDKFDSLQYGTASVGVRYSYVFGQRAERAALDQAQLAFARQVRAQEETEFVIQQQVRDAYDAVNSTWEVYRCQQERVTAARVQTEALGHLYAAGQLDLDRLLRARQQLSTALQQSNSALVDYNLAINTWRLAIGTMTIPLTTATATDSNRPNSSDGQMGSDGTLETLPVVPRPEQ